jgi:hypothetical protein
MNMQYLNNHVMSLPEHEKKGAIEGFQKCLMVLNREIDIDMIKIIPDLNRIRYLKGELYYPCGLCAILSLLVVRSQIMPHHFASSKKVIDIHLAKGPYYSPDNLFLPGLFHVRIEWIEQQIELLKTSLTI